MQNELLDILKKYWHYDAFRPLQEDIIRSVLDGKDTLALLPTGGGKSLCFQVPALARPGICLVVSPLIALIKDQVDQLRRKNITALALYSGMNRKEVINTLKVAGESNCKFLYVSPERLETSLFLEYLPSLPVSLIAVDEAHCVSQWGYDFRPPYLRIAALRKELPGIPLLALTASATPEVLTDIASKLEMPAPAIFRRPFTRPNLSYSVFDTESKVGKIAEILQKVPGSSIVYCKNRRAAGEISQLLMRQGIQAGAYHAGLPPAERSARQEDWLKDRLRVMVCTNAFGMGIDKSAVRTVIHADPPESLENYYQEAGRAGRDGQKAYAVLLWSGKESAQLAGMPDIRFPAMETIRKVYQALMNYLQLPAGSGEGNYYDFDLTGFVGRFKNGGGGGDAAGMAAGGGSGRGAGGSLTDEGMAAGGGTRGEGRGGVTGGSDAGDEGRIAASEGTGRGMTVGEGSTSEGNGAGAAGKGSDTGDATEAGGEGRVAAGEGKQEGRQGGGWNVQTVLHVIQALEQEGLLSLQQQVYVPAKGRFVAGKRGLYEFEKDHPALEPLIHALLRSYEGIFDQEVSIREKNLAYILRRDQREVVDQLIQLQAFHIIEYTPQKDTPQLYFLRNRVHAEELYIDPVKYRWRKQQYAERIRIMIQYLELKTGCRSRFLASYFGDKEAQDCGICDLCLAAKRL